MQYSEIIPLIRLRIYDERNPITVFRARNAFEESDEEYTAKVIITDTTIEGVVSTEEEGVNENWSFVRNNSDNFEALAQVIDNTPGWSMTGDIQNSFFLQENLMSLVGEDAFNGFASFNIRYRFTDKEIEREIDNVITEIDPTKTINELDLRYKMYVVNKVCCNLLQVRAVDTFGASDIDVSSIGIPGVNVAFTTTNKLWQDLAKVYCDLANSHGEMLVGGDISMPTINCNVVTRYDNYTGVESPYNGVAKPPSSIVQGKIRGSHPNYSVLLQWTKPDIMDFREYQILKIENGDIDIAEDGEKLVFKASENQYQHTVHYIDSDIEVGKTYTYRVMVIRNDVQNRKDIYSLSNVLKVDVPASTPPVASVVVIVGTLNVGDTLIGSYNYTDVDGDVEQIYNPAVPEILVTQCTEYSWYVADPIPDPNNNLLTIPGVWELIVGATDKDYVIQAGDTGKYLRFSVVPRNLLPLTTGLLVNSAEVKAL